MARVFFSDHLQNLCNNTRELEVPASSYRELVTLLECKFPGIQEILLERVAVSIDGQITHEPFLEIIAPDSEVYFLHRLAAG